MKSSSILDNILRGVSSRERADALARESVHPPAPTSEEMGRAVQPTPHAHQIPVRPRLPLAERITQAAGIYPEARAVTPPASSEEKLGPQTVHHIEHLERQVKMAEMRLKETRAQLEELDKKVRDAACKAVWLEKRYREMNPADVGFWVESEVFPALREVLKMGSIEKGGAL